MEKINIIDKTIEKLKENIVYLEELKHKSIEEETFNQTLMDKVDTIAADVRKTREGVIG